MEQDGAQAGVTGPAPGQAATLEELDGRPIVPARGPRPAAGWAGVVATGTVRAVARPALWAYGVLAFLARGGILLLLVPVVALPTFVGLANYVTPTAVTASGPTSRLVVLVAAWLVGIVAAILAGTLVAAAAETALYPAAVAADPDDPATALLPPDALNVGRGRRIVLTVAVVRLAMLLPVIGAVLVGLGEYVDVAYRELLLPSDLAVPLPVRVVSGAPGPTILLIACWLAGEVVGGLAARRVVLFGTGALRSLGSALVDVLVMPLSVILTLALSLVGSVLLVAPGLVAAALAWDRARIALVDRHDAAGVLLSAGLVAAAWGAALVLAALAAAWRSALWTAQLARRQRRPAG